MKNILILGLFAMLVGCSQQSPPPAPRPMPPPAPPVQPVAPVVPVQPPVVPRSHEYVRGYRDGYNGNWVAPLNWLLANEYRAGWSAGDRDRDAGLEPRIQ